MIGAIISLVAGATAIALFKDHISNFISIVLAIFEAIPQPFQGILIGFVAVFSTIMIAKITGVLK